MSEENIFDNSLFEEYEDDENDEEYEEYEDDEDDDQHNNNENRKQGTIVLDYDLDRDERKEIFQNYDLILCEKCNCNDKEYEEYEGDEEYEEYEDDEDDDQHNNNENKKQGTIVLDYDLDLDEREEIFQNYDLI